jgi:hypothetical protein
MRLSILQLLRIRGKTDLRPNKIETDAHARFGGNWFVFSAGPARVYGINCRITIANERIHP